MAITYELVKTVTAQLYDRSLRGIPGGHEGSAAARRRARIATRPRGTRCASCCRAPTRRERSSAVHLLRRRRAGVLRARRHAGAVQRQRSPGDHRRLRRAGGDHPAAAAAARHQPADAGARLQGQGHADRDVRPRRRRRLRRHHLLAEGARLRPLGGARDLQLSGSRDDREVRARDRDQRRLAALSAGGHRRRHRRHLRLRGQDGQGGDAAADRRGAPRADRGRHGTAARRGGQQDRLRPDGHRRRQHGDGGARELRRRSRLHAGGGGFNCWINRRTRARIYNDGRVEIVE